MKLHQKNLTKKKEINLRPISINAGKKQKIMHLKNDKNLKLGIERDFLDLINDLCVFYTKPY